MSGQENAPDVLAQAESIAEEAGRRASRYENDVLGAVTMNAADLAAIHRALEFLANAVAAHERSAAEGRAVDPADAPGTPEFAAAHDVTEPAVNPVPAPPTP